uniref:Uncharacterized protein n=1 Tax=Arundo donax TaxID=35708 RepID=A0A0A9C2F5_ARUDO
MSPEIMVL